MELFIVLGRVFFSSFANVFQKKLANKGLHSFFIVLGSYLVLNVICLPLFWFIDFSTLGTTFWLNICAAALLDMVGTLFLVMSLSKTDLSIFGPLNAYKVVLSMLLAFVFIGEIPSLQGLGGVAIIVIGSFFLFPKNTSSHSNVAIILLRDRGVQYRFLSILLFSVGTLPLKNAVIAGGALSTTVFWCVFGLPLALLLHTLFVKTEFKTKTQEMRQNLRHFITMGCMIFLMQYTTMIVFSHLLIAYSLALFQLNMVLQVFLGYRVFNEKDIKRRLVACIVMIAGSLLVLTTS